MNPLSLFNRFSALFAFFCLAALMGMPRMVRGRDIRFLAWDDEMARRSLLVVSGEQAYPVLELHPLQRSRTVTLVNDPENEFPVFLVDSADSSPDAENQNEGLPRIPLLISPEIDQPLVVLLPDESSPLGLRPLVLEDSREGFDWGSFRILNTTPSPLVFLTPDRRLELPPNWRPVDLRLNGNDNKPVVIGIEDPERGMLSIYSSIWMPSPESRRLVLILPSTDQRLGYLNLRIITEYPEPEPVPNGVNL